MSCGVTKLKSSSYSSPSQQVHSRPSHPSAVVSSYPSTNTPQYMPSSTSPYPPTNDSQYVIPSAIPYSPVNTSCISPNAPAYLPPAGNAPPYGSTEPPPPYEVAVTYSSAVVQHATPSGGLKETITNTDIVVVA